MRAIPDRVKLFFAVASTQLLPRKLRIARRGKLLYKLHKSKTNNADFMILNHPKSGGTWLRVMLSRLYHMRYNLPPQRLVKSDEFYNLDSSLPRFLVSNGYYTYERATQDAIDAMDPTTLASKKMILLARSPCDLAVSWHIQFNQRTSAYKRELINSSLQQPVEARDISLWDFTLHKELGIPGMIDFHNFWTRRLAKLPNGLVVRYEDLRSDPLTTMEQICAFLETPFSRAEIEHAVAFADIDNMRKLEANNYFKNSSMAPHKGRGPNTPKVRRGKVDGFRDNYSAEQVQIMEQMVANGIDSELGYFQD